MIISNYIYIIRYYKECYPAKCQIRRPVRCCCPTRCVKVPQPYPVEIVREVAVEVPRPYRVEVPKVKLTQIKR